MKDSGYDVSSKIINKRAAGYETSGDGYDNADFIDMGLPYAAGSLYSTVEDMYLYDRILNTEKLLSNKAIKSYKKSLEMYPGNQNAVQMLKQLEK
jgi:CubicO group peptidase (beta-lactamase class C family)